MKQLLTKYQIFTKLPQVSHIHKNRDFESIGQLLLSYNFFWQGHVKNLLFYFFSSCEPLSVSTGKETLLNGRMLRRLLISVK